MADNHRNTRQRNKSVVCSWNKIKQKRATNEGNAKKKKEKVVWFRDEAISRSIQYGAALAHVWRTKRTNDSSALLAKREGERKRVKRIDASGHSRVRRCAIWSSLIKLRRTSVASTRGIRAEDSPRMSNLLKLSKSGSLHGPCVTYAYTHISVITHKQMRT